MAGVRKIKKTRKRHKNSKLGCANCRRRQIKCDESLPICHNCIRRNDACSYLFMPSQEFQQLVGLKTSVDGKAGVLKDCEGSSSQNNEDTTPETDDKTRGTSESRTESDKKIFKAPNVYDVLTNSVTTEESDTPNFDRDLITPYIDTGLKPESWLWKKYENTSESSHLLTSSDNECSDMLPDQPYEKIGSEYGNTFVPPNIYTSHVGTYMYGSAIDTQFFKYKKNNKQSKIKIQCELNPSTDGDRDSDEKDYEDNHNVFVYNEHEESLPSSRQPYRKFKLNPAVDQIWFSPFYQKISHFFRQLQSKSLSTSTNTPGSKIDIDKTLDHVIRVQTRVEMIFSKIIRKTSILLVSDIIKNVLVKQPSILPTMSQDFRIRICRVCEDYTVMELEVLKKMINETYVPAYSSFNNIQKELINTAFVHLAMSTAYHYNSGYRQTMSIEQSVQCVKYIGTFSAGVFSIIISEYDQPLADPVHFIRILSKHLLITSKLIVLPNYNSRCFVEIYSRFQLLESEYRNSDRKSRWSSDLINLSLFFEKHSIFLRTFKEQNSLLGYDKGYLIRLINEWYQIFPAHLINITSYDAKNIDNDFQISILIYLTYLAISYQLEAIVPGIRSLVRVSFIGSGRQDHDSISNIMKAYRLIKRKDFKVYAIYTIRVLAFFQPRFEYSKLMLFKLDLPEFSGYPEMSIEEKCERLRKWKYSGSFYEISRTSFDLFCGTFIEKRNYPSLKPPQGMPPPERKICFQNVEELIYDFENTNSGLLSGDYNPKTQSLDIQGKDMSSTSNASLAPIIANTADEEVNAIAMKNCWHINNYVKLGNPIGG